MKAITAIFLTTLLLPAATSALANDADSTGIVERIEARGLIEITAPAALLERLAPMATAESPETAPAPATSIHGNTKVGYRVQVFDDNDVRTAKDQAQARSRQLQSRFPEWHAYIQFNSPYWRVKVGDFKTRSEAEAAMAAIRAAFPGLASQLRVVRDKINN